MLTLLVVAYVVVPPVARFVGAVGGYNPAVDDPKDEGRQTWLGEQGAQLGLPRVPLDVIINVLLILLVAIVWLSIVPPGASRRR